MEDALIALLPRLRRFARALCRDDDEADDLVQSACERALTSKDRFEPGTNLMGPHPEVTLKPGEMYQLTVSSH